ncbi:MAG TPA: glycosyltransferase family 4 protein [Candidatus Eisenbacteria bacterium]|nr:glycosyltransferase family 4 protein [Candidatus Eisenbacteria bacterium]
MRIVFALPGSGDAPVGGFKVVYAYAGGLAERGHEVSVLHPARLNFDASFADRTRGMARYLRLRATGQYDPRSWFSMHPRVRVSWVPSLDARHVPDADVVVATAWQTAEWVVRYPSRTGRKYYLIQSLETWSGPESRVLATWTLPLRKIVIARWLENVATRLGQDAVYIPNGLDLTEFGVDVLPESRDPRSVLMMFHHLPVKGSGDGLAAMRSLREEFPDLSLHLFGVPEPPSDLPAWAIYHRQPRRSELRRLYNEAAVFLSPSRTEGWALPPAEAMLCGAALAATDIGGHADYATHEDTALLSPPERPDLLAANIERYFLEPELRIRLAHRGAAWVREFTWPKALDRFEAELQRDA